ncbi:hypothetical protein B0T22DRAFT_168018 [Podospora appendiculata]|uniref:MARVEL domain-containing protein n=1 Tax=Podospora appendiculata TaxID=314037 RepID=A0AAE0XAL0_9PEZI|nr:hypothetical protein B0T22DRAFT_168018 [Podospora appendiculata]
MEQRPSESSRTTWSTEDEEERLGRHSNRERRRQPQRQRGCANPWLSAKTILGAFSIMLSIAALGLGIKMVVAYGDKGLVHVSFVFIGFSAAASVAWQCLELITMCVHSDRSGLSPGAHVGVHICLCLACLATMGYIGIWVAHGDHLNRLEFSYPEGMQAEDLPKEYAPLYHMGIVVVIILLIMLLVNFVLAILACRKVRKKDDNFPVYNTVVTVRYDGVGPTGTARPRSLDHGIPATVVTPSYRARQDTDVSGMSSPPIIIPRGDLGVEVFDEPNSSSQTGFVEKPRGTHSR